MCLTHQFPLSVAMAICYFYRKEMESAESDRPCLREIAEACTDDRCSSPPGSVLLRGCRKRKRG